MLADVTVVGVPVDVVLLALDDVVDLTDVVELVVDTAEVVVVDADPGTHCEK